ncbi:MAG: DUF2867 domain-containing protein [Planctomycetota bacterium]
MRVLVTGGTGYIGGRLAPRLVERGHDVRVSARDLARLKTRPWAGVVKELVEADLADADSLAAAVKDVDVAYYLVHSMTHTADFRQRDRELAEAFGRACAEAGVKHVVYLGGLQPSGTGHVSEHLESRAEVGRVLAEHVAVTELRAGPIIGSGSASFEMVRYLTERLPVMVTPRWVRHEVDCIAVRDMMGYLIAAAERFEMTGEAAGVVDVAGDRLKFREMMEQYAAVRGHRRWIFPTPVLAPGFAARWVGFVTPITNRLAVPLVEGMCRPLLADTSKAKRLFPEVEPIAYRRAVELALRKIKVGDIETRWSGAVGQSPSETVELRDEQGLIREVRTAKADCSPECLYDAFTSLGGEKGWLTWGWAWRMRGWMDAAIGGPGLRRGRRHPTELLIGETLDFWRVETVERPRLMRLRAEMKVPGRAWLQYEAIEEGGQTYLRQSALFDPMGLPGWLYWWSLYPIHLFIFTDMAKAVVRDAEALSRSRGDGDDDESANRAIDDQLIQGAA